MKKKIFVGLSGGVDSAVSAALLQEQGHDVTGVFIKIWQPEFIECTWRADRLDAMRVCASLGIPFREIDLSDEYKREVIDSMIAGYRSGITPNPDVLCNRSIKFGSFAHWAYAHGADYVATGHYARVFESKGHFELHRSLDSAKDQSYFLYRLREDDLKSILFPVGAFTKKDIRVHAQRFALPVARKPDSQGLCFVGEVTMSEFLKRYMPLTAGDIIDTDGKIIGMHEGASLYTIGQRHGFTANTALPLYVIGIDTVRNQLRVSADKNAAAVDSVTMTDFHTVSAGGEIPPRVLIQARYHEKPVGATLHSKNGEVVAVFDKKHIAARGQSLVAYVEDKVIGGGTVA